MSKPDEVIAAIYNKDGRRFYTGESICGQRIGMLVMMSDDFYDLI